MEFITHFFQALRSPRTALVLFLFSGALLFVPTESLGIPRPQFAEDYQTQILIVFFLFLFDPSLGTWRFVFDATGCAISGESEKETGGTNFLVFELKRTLCALGHDPIWDKNY